MTADQLPDDPNALKAMVLARDAENARLIQIIKELQRHRFGRRAETLPEDQLLLGLEEAEQIEAAGEEENEQASPAEGLTRIAKRRTNRGALPPHLPRIEMVVDIEDHACPCCRSGLHRIGEDVSERLDIVPAQLRVIVVRRPKYACRACEDVVVQAPAPARLMEGGLPTEATVAQVLVSKYADHLPLYRQAQIYARQGINLDRSTLADWVGRAAWHLRPVHARLLGKLKASPKLFADETTAPVLDPGRGKTKTGQLWAYARDDRPWDGADPPGVAYVYAPDRKAERPIAHLAGFTGILQVDGYGGYRVLADKSGVTLAFCWAHVRRRFYELAVAGPAPIASEALKRIAELYKIEDGIRGLPADERRAVRQEKTVAIIADLEPWLREKLGLISQKTKLAEAICYALSRWEGLTRFLNDGRIEIDSNTVERSIRPIALNRKNALFAGSDGGAEHWAVVASLIETCKLNGVDPLGYIADVLTRIVSGHPNSQIDELLPWGLHHRARTQGRGLRTPLTIVRTVRRFEQLEHHDEILDRIVVLRAEGATARQIADDLNAKGWRPAKKPMFDALIVQKLLVRRGLGKKRPIWSGNVPRRNDDEVTLQELSEQLCVHRQTAYGWLRRGKLKGRIAKVGTQRIWLVSLSHASTGIRTGESS